MEMLISLNFKAKFLDKLLMYVQGKAQRLFPSCMNDGDNLGAEDSEDANFYLIFIKPGKNLLAQSCRKQRGEEARPTSEPFGLGSDDTTHTASALESFSGSPPPSYSLCNFFPAATYPTVRWTSSV